MKPMLGVTAEKDKIKFPAMVSLKLDGIRCVCMNGELFSRSLKPIGNIQLRDKFKEMMDYSKEFNVIFDGEFYSHDLTFQEITSMVNSSDKEISDSLKFNCFDFIQTKMFDEGFKGRYERYCLCDIKHMVKVEQTMVKSIKDMDKMFERALQEGYEGLIVRSPDGEYKFGRSTVNQGWMLKLKPFASYDLKITGVVERMENLNKSQKNELGRSFKRNTKNDKKSTGIASCFETIYNGFPMRVTLTGDEVWRRSVWKNKEDYIGKMMEVKGMEVGAKDVLRHPTLLRMRPDRD